MSRLVVLKFPRWRLERACPILLGLGSGFSFGSPLVLIFDGLENSLTFDFSALTGFSGTIGGGGSDGSWACDWIAGDV